jgi:hypothetical protein
MVSLVTIPSLSTATIQVVRIRLIADTSSATLCGAITETARYNLL